MGKGLGWNYFLSDKGTQYSADTCVCTGALQGPGPRDKQKKKKKKEKPREFRSDPPIQRILGSERVALDALLATETLVATVCDFGILITEQLLQSPSQEEKLVRSCPRGQGNVAGEGAQHILPCSILTSIPQLPSP